MTLPVDRIETFVVRIGTRADFRWNGLERPLGEVFVVRVTSGSLVGYGETVPLPDWGGPSGAPFGETPRIDAVVVHELAGPVLLGRDATELSRRRAEIRAAVIGYPYALGALDIALHDLVARNAGVPMYELLGGRHREAVPIAHMIGLMGADEAEVEAAQALGEGCLAFQVKGGQDAERDVRLIARLRELAGPEVVLRLDANCGYGGWKSGLEAVHALEDAGVTLVEQPVGGLDDLRRVTQGARVPIVADELCWSPADALRLLDDRAADALSIYVAKAAGIAGATTVARIAAAASLPHDLNGSLEAGIGNAASLQVAMASEAELLPCVIPINGPADDLPSRIFGRYFVDDVVGAGFGLRDGSVVLGDGPGLGIDVDEEKLQRLTVAHRDSHVDQTKLEVSA
jgi:L-alanine-DL-glutamate epimerase-like enolase superfamily enzyme